MKKIAVIGGGDFGIAIAAVCSRNTDNVVHLYSRDTKKIESINHGSKCPGWDDLNLCVVASSNLGSVITDADCIFVVVTSVVLMEVIRDIGDIVSNKDVHVVLCSKGVLGSKDNFFYSDAITSVMPSARVSVLSGPSFAREIANNVYTVVSLASTSMKDVLECESIISGNNVGVYRTTDVYGVQLMGAFKNVIAFRVGIEEGLIREFYSSYSGDAVSGNLSDYPCRNKIAALMVTLLDEGAKLMNVIGGKYETMFSPSGIGDILLTCGSRKSRNRDVGEWVGAKIAREVLRGIPRSEVKGVYDRFISDINYVDSVPLSSNIFSTINTEVTIEGIYATKKIHEYSVSKGLNLSQLCLANTVVTAMY